MHYYFTRYCIIKIIPPPACECLKKVKKILLKNQLHNPNFIQRLPDGTINAVIFPYLSLFYKWHHFCPKLLLRINFLWQPKYLL